MFENFEMTPEVKTQLIFLTGITDLKVIAFNPQEALLGDIIGKENAAKFDTIYAAKNNMGVMETPVVIWVQDVEEKINPFPIQINLSDTDDVASTGSIKIINDKLQDSYSSSIQSLTDNPNMGWFSKDGIRAAKKGEVSYYNFICKLLKIDTKEKNYIEILSSEGIDFNTVRSGNFDGLRKLVGYLTENQFSITGLLTVKQTVNENGTRNKQKLSMRPDTWFKYNGSSVKDRLTTLHAKDVANGRSLSNNLFTYDLMEFDKDKCINAEPEFNGNPAANTLAAPAKSPWT